MFSSNYVRYYLMVYMRFLCFDHSRVNFTPSMLSGNVLEWSKKYALRSCNGREMGRVPLTSFCFKVAWYSLSCKTYLRLS